MFKAKFAIAAAAAFVGTAVLANDNSITAQHTQDRSNVIVLENVTSSSAGDVTVRVFHRGETGEVLGMERVNEGANNNVRIQLKRQPSTDLIVVLHNDDTEGDVFKMIDIAGM